jgi:hypothetical protein
MPEITTCPDCDKKLKVPDNLIGKKVRCPGCNVMFVARADGAAEEEAPVSRSADPARREGISERRAPARDDRDDRDDRDEREERPRSRYRDEREERPRSRDREERIRRRDDDHDDRPRRRDDYDDRPRRRDDYDDDYPRQRPGDVAKGWRLTRIGVYLVAVSVWLMLAALGVGLVGVGVIMLLGGSLIGSILGGGSINEGSAATGVAGIFGAAIGYILFASIVGLLYVGGVIVKMVGQGLCMAVPVIRGSNTMRILAIVVFSCGCLSIVITFVGAALRVQAVGLLSNALDLAAWVCWIILLRLIAIECRAPDLGGRLITFLICGFVYGLVAVLLIIIAACAGGAAAASAVRSGSAGGAGAIFIIVMLVIGLILLVGVGLWVWYGLLLQQVRDQIARHLNRIS